MLYTIDAFARESVVPAKRCSASREGKVLLSCWISPELRQELDQLWIARGFRSHGRVQKGMEEMIGSYLQAMQQAPGEGSG